MAWFKKGAGQKTDASSAAPAGAKSGGATADKASAKKGARLTQARATSAKKSAVVRTRTSAGASPTAQAQPQADGRTLSREVHLRHLDRGEIARGGMGSIRKVFDTNLQRTVAMKVLFAEHKQDADMMQRFAEEAQIMGQLEHPNIVPVHDFGDDFIEGGAANRFFTMKYVRGKTLTEILQSDTYEVGSHEAYFRLLTIFAKVCDAVAFAHSRGVIHRDLKPDNIMVGAFGEVYLMDWGISKLLGRATKAPAMFGNFELMGETPEPVQVRRAPGKDDETNQIIGTFHYMAPEQALAKVDDVDERTDVFLLGGVLYEILTGQPPFFAETVVHVVRAAQKCAVLPPDVVAPDRNIPSVLTRICMRCLKADRQDRYPSALALKEEIESFLKGGASFPMKTFKAGTMLMQEGAPGDEVFFINRGLVQVYKTYGDGHRQGLATLGPGAVVGEAAVLTTSVRTASVVAVEDTVATVVSRTQLEQELGPSSWMGALVKALADRFVGVDDKLDEARAELNAATIESWFLEAVLARGERIGAGTELPLMATLRACRHALKKPEPELRRVLEKSKRFRLDEKRDRLVFAPS